MKPLESLESLESGRMRQPQASAAFACFGRDSLPLGRVPSACKQADMAVEGMKVIETRRPDASGTTKTYIARGLTRDECRALFWIDVISHPSQAWRTKGGAW